MVVIFHIADAIAWERAGSSGEYRAPSLEAEGFIHASTAEQVVGVADRFYRGQAGLVLLCINGSVLPDVRFEGAAHPDGTSSSSDERFPHIYGPIPTAGVLRVVPFEPRSDGTFALPLDVHALTSG